MSRATPAAPGSALPPAAADAAVRTESLGKTYPDGTVAVAGLSLAVRRGEVLGLLGPKGIPSAALTFRSTTPGSASRTGRP